MSFDDVEVVGSAALDGAAASGVGWAAVLGLAIAGAASAKAETETSVIRVFFTRTLLVG
jgi:hypothetical protein